MSDPRKWKDYLTVGQLKAAISELADDTPVMIERVEDVYFEEHGWVVVKKDGVSPFYDSEYVRAFAAGQCRDDGALYIDAHY